MPGFCNLLRVVAFLSAIFAATGARASGTGAAGAPGTPDSDGNDGGTNPFSSTVTDGSTGNAAIAANPQETFTTNPITGASGQVDIGGAGGAGDIGTPGPFGSVGGTGGPGIDGGSGGGGANLTVGTQTYNSLRSGIGAKAATRLWNDNDGLVIGTLTGLWNHEYFDSLVNTSVQYAAGNNAFLVPTAAPVRDTGKLGLQFDYLHPMKNRFVTASLKYDLEFGQNYISNGGWFKIRRDF